MRIFEEEMSWEMKKICCTHVAFLHIFQIFEEIWDNLEPSVKPRRVVGPD